MANMDNANELLAEQHRLFDGVPEEVIWITSVVIAFFLPWLADWDLVAYLAGGLVFAVWGGVIVINMGKQLRANGVYLKDEMFFVAVFFSWIMVILLLIRFGSRAVYAQK